MAMLHTLARRLTPGRVDVPPSERYLGMVVRGSEKALLDQEYLDYLHGIKAAVPWPVAGKVFATCMFPMNQYGSEMEVRFVSRGRGGEGAVWRVL